MSLAWGGVNIMGQAHNWTPSVDDEITPGGAKFTARTAASLALECLAIATPVAHTSTGR